MRNMSSRLLAIVAALSMLVVVACGSNSSSNSTTPPVATGTSTGTASAGACATPPVNTAGTLLVGAEFPAPPFEIPPLDNPTGFEVDLINEIAKRLNIGTVKWENFPFTRAVTVGLQPPFDLDINEITITPERAQVVDFSDPYFDANQGLLVRDGTPIASATSIADLKPYQLGTQAATTGLAYTKDTIKPDSPPRQFDTVTLAANALVLAKSIDGFVMDVPIVIGLSKEQAYQGTSVIGQFITNEKYGILFKKGNPLVSCVNQALASITGDGTLKTMQEKWFPGITEVATLS
jgi:polar amino acid transport system substrate-binding protein